MSTDAATESPRRGQKRTATMMVFPEGKAAAKAVAISDYLEKKPKCYADPASVFEVEFDETSPSSVAANPSAPFFTPPGPTMIYVDADPDKKTLSFTFKLTPETDVGNRQLREFGDFVQFGPKSKLAKQFFEKAVGDKTNKIFKRMNDKKMPAQARQDYARKDVTSDGKASFTKKIVEKDLDQLDEENPDACPVVLSLKTNFATKDGQAGWTTTELDGLPVAIGDFFRAGGQLRACPFKMVDGSRLDWDEVLPLLTMSKNGFVYMKARSARFNITGAIHRWTAENPATKSNYNRILTLLFGATTVYLYAVEQRNREVEEDEAPDEDLLAAFNSAGAE